MRQQRHNFPSAFRMADAILKRMRVRDTPDSGRVEIHAARARSTDAATAPALSMYKDSSLVEEITMNMFEELGATRLDILKAVAANASHIAVGAREHRRALDARLRNSGLDDATKDAASHYVLRFCMASNPERRAWFVHNESLLFQHRVASPCRTAAEKERALAMTGIRGRFISHIDTEPITTFHGVIHVERSSGRYVEAGADVPDNATEFYELMFEDAIALVGSRTVFVNAGFAYVPAHLVDGLVASAFKASLKTEVDATAAWNALGVDPRMPRLVAAVNENLELRSRKALEAGALLPEQIDVAATTHFSPCMQVMHARLTADAHLKYDARTAFAAFLKGAGLTADDAVRYWRTAMSRKVSAAVFDREYRYPLRHIYGLEGKRKEYGPQSCHQIINGHAARTDVHGCPFKLQSPEELAKTLAACGTLPEKAALIIEKAQYGFYGVACSEYYRATHDDERPDRVIRSPNDYYFASVAAAKGAGAAPRPA